MLPLARPQSNVRSEHSPTQSVRLRRQALSKPIICPHAGASGSLGLAPQQQQQLQQLTNGVQLTPAMLQAAAKAMAASGGLEHLNRMRSAGAAW